MYSVGSDTTTPLRCVPTSTLPQESAQCGLGNAAPTPAGSSHASEQDPGAARSGPAGTTSPNREGMVKAAVLREGKLRPQGSKKRKGGRSQVQYATSLCLEPNSSKLHPRRDQICQTVQGGKARQICDPSRKSRGKWDLSALAQRGAGPHLKPAHLGQQNYFEMFSKGRCSCPA